MTDHNTDGSEQRITKRSSLMLRSAKLVCQSGEYVCIIRDVSADGVGLSFLHAVPTEARIILELANGATYPVERVWAGKQQAGYRFARSIELQDFIHEPSPYEARPIRLRIRTEAAIESSTGSHAANLVDFSSGGALIECRQRLAFGSRVTLDLRGAFQRSADICWRKGAQHGLMFHSPIAIEQLAETALALQPFDAPRPMTFGRRTAPARAA